MPSRFFPLFKDSNAFPFFARLAQESLHSPTVAKGNRQAYSHAHSRLFGFKLGFGVGAGASILVFVLFLLLRLLKYIRQRQNKVLTKHPENSIFRLKNFAYRELKSATQGFNAVRKLGQGGFGAVYKGVLKDSKEVAVKKLDAGSFQGEREFQNELSVIGHVCVSPHIVPLVGFCSNGKQRLLVYEYMPNHSLQEALFDEDYPAQLHWDKRFSIIVDTCKALAFLHTCEPPIIHGDIKPSNVLLDAKFCAKIADFGLARFKKLSTEQSDVPHETVYVEEPRIRNHRRVVEKQRKHMKLDASVASVASEKHESDVAKSEVIETQSISTVFTTSPDSDASSLIGKLTCDSSQTSTDGNAVQHDSLLSDSDIAACPSPFLEPDNELLRPNIGNQVHIECIAHDVVAQETGTFDIKADTKAASHEETGAYCSNEVELLGGIWQEKRNNAFSSDWWWRQESSGELSAKDFVMDWMGHEDRKRTSIKESALSGNVGCGKEEWSKNSRPSSRRGYKERRDCLKSLEQENWSSQEKRGLQQAQNVVLQINVKKGENQRQAGGLLSKKGSSRYPSDVCAKANDFKVKDSTHSSWRSASLEWWRDDSTEEVSSSKNGKERFKSREWWKDEEGISSKEWKAIKKKRESALSREWSGELSSKGVSSTPSMRGTLCYVAPENCGSGIMSSEKSDVYSFGVLLLVIISGRRPLQVTASPITEFERANLISWARHLAHSGNVLELVDPSLQEKFCRKQATLCITVALLCLDRSPLKRPSMIDALKMLAGELEVPSLPFRFSPSPPRRVRHQSRKCSLSSEGVAADFTFSN
ncbi:hypothetical protein L7F22_058683 [Adiantum nelumboides]|nr:hypothetical protein [Adiantum nelumboides]